jgi:hypothetical protein
MTQYQVQAQLVKSLGDDEMLVTRQVPTFIVDSAYQGGQTAGDMLRVVLDILGTDQFPPGSSWSVTMQNLTTKTITTVTSEGRS